jgi:hypothetical protein
MKLPRPFYQQDIESMDRDYWINDEDFVNPYHYCGNGCRYYYRRLCARKNYEATCPWCALTDHDVGFLMRSGACGGCEDYEYGTMPELYYDKDKNCKKCIEFNDINKQCAKKVFVEDGNKVCKYYIGHNE